MPMAQVFALKLEDSFVFALYMKTVEKMRKFFSNLLEKRRLYFVHCAMRRYLIILRNSYSLQDGSAF